MTRQRFVAGLGAALAFPALPLQRALGQTLEPLRIATSPSDLGAEPFYAKDLGLFAKAGLDAQISPISNGAAIAAGVIGGAIDIGWSNVISLAAAHEKGVPFTILATAALFEASAPTSGTLAVLKSSPITSAKDLSGKTIAILGLHNISDLSLREWLDQNGGDSKSVKIVEMPYSAMGDALRSGRVDAASVDTSADPLLGKPGATLRVVANVFAAIAPRFAASVWFSTTDWATKHPADAQKFVAVMKQTTEWANRHRAESAQILAKNTSLTLAAIESVPRVSYAVEATSDLIQPQIDSAAKYGSIAAAFPAKDLISPFAITK
jgi:NitT/TauT family transport system substrate-binding protein